MRLPAVAALPRWKIPEREFVEEALVLRYELGRHFTNLDRADLRQAFQLHKGCRVRGKAQTLQDAVRLRVHQADRRTFALPRKVNAGSFVRFGQLPYDGVRRRRRECRGEHKAGTHREAARGIDLDKLRLLRHRSVRAEPADMRAGCEVTVGGKAVVPVATARRHEHSPQLARRHREIELPRAPRHDASRATVFTSLTPSSFSISRDSCARESISTVAETTAVLSSYT